MGRVFDVLLRHSRRDEDKQPNGIILAAGASSRYRSTMGTDQSKCVAQFHGKSMLFHKINHMLRYVDSIVVVLGYDAERIRDTVTEEFDGVMPERVSFIVNTDYDKEENWLSLKLGLDAVSLPVIINEGDAVFPSKLIENMASLHGNILACKKSQDAVMKVKIDSDGFVEQMTKDPLQSFYGDYIGLCRLEGPLPKWKLKKYYEFDLIASSSFRVMEIYDQPYVNMNRQIDYLKALEIYEG